MPAVSATFWRFDFIETINLPYSNGYQFSVVNFVGYLRNTYNTNTVCTLKLTIDKSEKNCNFGIKYGNIFIDVFRLE